MIIYHFNLICIEFPIKKINKQILFYAVEYFVILIQSKIHINTDKKYIFIITEYYFISTFSVLLLNRI